VVLVRVLVSQLSVDTLPQCQTMGSNSAKLVEYAKDGNLEAVKECITNGTNINYTNRVNIEYIIESIVCVVLPLWYGVLSLHPSPHYSCHTFLLFHYRMDIVPFTGYAFVVIFQLRSI